MRWDDWLAVIFPLLLKVVGWLVPAIGGALGGPLGWIVSFLLSKGTAMLADMAEQAARFGKISAEIRAQVADLSARSQEFFEIEDRRERGEPLLPQEREEAKAKLKEAAKNLIKLKKKEEAAK